MISKSLLRREALSFEWGVIFLVNESDGVLEEELS
jgi:hypothetical protein